VTKNKKQKKLIRERAARSGTRYTTAMRSLAPKKAGHAEDRAGAVATLDPAMKAAFDFPLAHVLARYMKDHGVSQADAAIRDRELRRYLCLAARNPSAGWPMVPALDSLWHTFLLFTKDYQRFCQALGVPFIHHQPFDDAPHYTLRQWDTLVRYLDDGRLEIDNNRVERQMRSVAVGRKNWMFAGSAEGARRAATAYSLVGTCGLLGIEPWAYLQDVLQKIAEGADPANLTPRLWQAARSQAAAH
jgi:hypothetical protein